MEIKRSPKRLAKAERAAKANSLVKEGAISEQGAAELGFASRGSAQGSQQTNLTNYPAYDWDAAWSPEGSKIAFASDRDSHGEVYVMMADGSQQTNLTNNPAYDWDAAWSPDGSKIAFYSVRDGSGEVYTVNADGSEQTRLTNTPGDDGGPAWASSPAPVTSSSFIGPGVSFQLLAGQIDGLTATIDGTVFSSDFDIARIVWDWGDGTAEESWFPGRHSYTEPGRYTLTVRVYDVTGTEIAGQSGLGVANH